MPHEVDAKLAPEGLLEAAVPMAQSRLHDRFGIPPFSVWNTREGWWQDRRRAWLALGIKSDEGREDKLTFNIPLNFGDRAGGPKIKSHIRAQTSVFDPVLCEFAYRMFCPQGGVVVDPFCGGSVRGIVASVLGMRYAGVDLRPEQVAANQAQLTAACTGTYPPMWRAGDSLDMMRNVPEYDFLFSCPPYGNLEVYSDLEKDISNMDYDGFLNTYEEIIARASARLANNRFACFVVANFRHKTTGHMHDLVGDTTRAFKRAGLHFYNEIILVNAVGTACIRANNSFKKGKRKIVKTHQNVLVFVKGDQAVAADACVKAGEQYVDRHQ